MKLKVIGKVIQTAPILHLLHQGEANADLIEMELPKRYEETDLSALQYTVYGVSEQETLASQLLERSLSGEMVRLRWKVSKDFTAVGGKLSLWIAGVNSAGTTVIKFIGKSVEVSPSPGGELAPPDFNAFEQALTRMQALLASAEQSERSASASKTAAAASEKAAAGSASTAAAKATAAEASANKAKTSETNSKASETAAKNSETNAAGSASTAAAKASAAEASANKAKTSETNAKTSETNAKASETAAAKSRTDAQASANTAASEAGKAAASAAAAKASETGASQSAAAAKTSETAAGASASAAKASADTAAQSAETAVNAAVRQPVPKDDGFWHVWDAASNDYAKTEFPYQGPKGDTGTSFRVLGLYPTLGELTAEHPTGAENEAWAVGTEEENVIYLWDTGSLHWVNLGSIKGPPGKDGAKGEKGADGIIGKDGKSAYQCAVGAGYSGTEAQFNAALSKAKDLSNVDNVKQYSASNPPPYPVTTVAGKTGAVTLAKADVGLSNVDNVKQSTATNLLNGAAQGSLRAVRSALETADYKLGLDAIALGNSTKASGAYSVATGYDTTASGYLSTAMGNRATASGSESAAIGSSVEASGTYSTAMGVSVKTSGYASFASGKACEARGNSSSARGAYCIAHGDYSIADGHYCFCDSAYSAYAAGLSAIAASTQCAIPIASYSEDTLTVLNDGTVNYLNSAFSKIKEGMEVFVWNTYYANIMHSKYTVKSADAANYTITLNRSFPSSAYAVKWVVIPEIRNTSRYYPAISMGKHTAALGNNSWASGEFTVASGENSFATGFRTTASSTYSAAFGISAIASGTGSTVFGSGTKATGSYSAAFGSGSQSLGISSFSAGANAVAAGGYSTAFGAGTAANGAYSLTSGYHTKAEILQLVYGHHNLSLSGGAINTTAGSAFILGNGSSDTTRSNCFRVQYDGQVFSKGNYSTTGADYAELFEWEDGNPNKEDRRGHFVALRGNKIHIAQPGEIAVGVISSTAAVIGNNPSETWQKMYLTDIWGDVLTEYKEFPAKVETIQHPAELGLDEDGNEVVLKEAWTEEIETEPEFKGQVPILNPDYNPDEKYIPRHERPEWGIVGLYGQLIVLDDGTCQVNGFCACAGDGTATASSKGYLVIERLDGTHIRILSNFLNTQQQIDNVQAQQDEAAIDTDFRLLMLEMN